MSHGPYDEDWRRTAEWLRIMGRQLVDAARERRFRDIIAPALVMVVNPTLLLIGHRWRRRECPCCGWQGVGFLWGSDGLRLLRDSACPHCESRSRHRALTLLIPATVDPAATATVLHFAPEPVLYEPLRRRFAEAAYQTTDLERTDVDLPGLDIQHLDLADASYDLVVCNHVLEHVPDDRAAVAELARITRPRGVTFLSVPGDWDGTPTRTLAPDHWNGHHRHYGNDLIDLLRSSFGDVQAVTAEATPDAMVRYAIRPNEPIFVCRP